MRGDVEELCVLIVSTHVQEPRTCKKEQIRKRDHRALTAEGACRPFLTGRHALSRGCSVRSLKKRTPQLFAICKLVSAAPLFLTELLVAIWISKVNVVTTLVTTGVVLQCAISKLAAGPIFAAHDLPRQRHTCQTTISAISSLFSELLSSRLFSPQRPASPRPNREENASQSSNQCPKQAN